MPNDAPTPAKRYRNRSWQERAEGKTPDWTTPLKNPVQDAGTVRLRIREVATARGILGRQGKVNRAELQRRTNISDGTLFYLIRHPELTDRIHLSTLAKLCHGLQTTPGELLEYIPHNGGATPLSDQYKADPGKDLEV